MSKPLIYGLIDPNTLMVRYIGQSCTGMTRPNSHKRPATLARNRQHSGNWIRKLLSEGHLYEVVVLEYVPTDHLNDAEIWWIAYGRALGWPLTNHTDGGGGLRGRKMPERERQLRSKMFKGRTMSPEWRANVTAGIHKRWEDPEEHDKQSAAMQARWARPEERKTASEKTQAFFEANPQARERSRETLENNWANPEVRERMVAGRSERSKLPEVRAKLQAGAAKFWADPIRSAAARKARSERVKGPNNPRVKGHAK